MPQCPNNHECAPLLTQGGDVLPLVWCGVCLAVLPVKGEKPKRTPWPMYPPTYRALKAFASGELLPYHRTLSRWERAGLIARKAGFGSSWRVPEGNTTITDLGRQKLTEFESWQAAQKER